MTPNTVKAPERPPITPETLSIPMLLGHGEDSKRLLMGQLQRDYHLGSKRFTRENIASIEGSKVFRLGGRLERIFNAIEERSLHGKEASIRQQAVLAVTRDLLIGRVHQVILDRIRRREIDVHTMSVQGQTPQEVTVLRKQIIRTQKEASLQAVITANNTAREIAAGAELTRMQLRAILQNFGFEDDLDEMRHLEAGMAAEVATYKSIQAYIEANQDGAGSDVERTVRFGAAKEDSKGGDIVYEVDGRKYFIDVKASGLGQAAAAADGRAGYELGEPHHEASNFRRKITVWPSGRDAIDNDLVIREQSFTDALSEVLAAVDRDH